MSGLSEIFSVLLERSVTASVIIFAIIVIRVFIQKLPKKYSYALWTIAAIRLLFPISIKSTLSLFNLSLLNQTKSLTGVTKRITSNSVTAYQTVIPEGTGNYSTAGQTSSLQAETLSNNPLQTFLFVATVCWLIGMLVLIAYSVVSYLKLKKRVATGILLQDNVYQCDSISSPFVLGLFRPRIYIPYGLEDKEQQYILEHEAYHIRRKDYIIKMLAFGISVVYWFQPFVWVAFFLMQKDMEMSCDEAVIRKFGTDIQCDYSTSLLAFATNQRHPFFIPLAFGETDTKRRVKNIFHYKKPKFWMTIAGIVILILVAMVCLTNSISKNIISFADEPESGAGGETIQTYTYSLEDNINSYLIYADLYQDGNYVNSYYIAKADLSNATKNGEFSLSLTPQGNGVEGFNVLSALYSHGGNSEFTSIPLPQECNGCSTVSYNSEMKSFEINPGEHQLMNATFFGELSDGETHAFTVQGMRDARINNEQEYMRMLSENPVTIIFYIATSNLASDSFEQDWRETIEQEYGVDPSGTTENGLVIDNTNTSNGSFTIDILIKMFNEGGLNQLDYGAYDNFTKLESPEEALDETWTTEFVYQGKVFTLCISVMQGEISPYNIYIQNNESGDAVLLYDEDSRYIVTDSLEDFLNADTTAISDWLTISLPEGYNLDKYQAGIGINGGALILPMAYTIENEESSWVAVDWMSAGSISKIEDTSSDWFQFENSQIIKKLNSYWNHTTEVKVETITNLEVPAILYEANHDLYTASELYDLEEQQISISETTSDYWNIYFAKENGTKAYYLSLTKKDFSKEDALAIAATIHFTENAFN